MTRDYREFLEAAPVAPPPAVSRGILERARRDLDPTAWRIFGKLSLVHLVVGAITLSICPQFGFRLFGEGLGFMRYFAALGDYGCMAACGAFFIGMSLLVAGLLIRPSELRVLRRTGGLQVGAVVSLSLGAILMADAEILLGFGAAWVFGSWVGGMAALEFSWLLRKPAA